MMFWINQRRALLAEEASRCWWPAVRFSPTKLPFHPRKCQFSLVYCPALFFFVLSLPHTVWWQHLLSVTCSTTGDEDVRKWQSRGTGLAPAAVNRDTRRKCSKCGKKLKMQKLQKEYFFAINVFTCLNKTSEMSSCCLRWGQNCCLHGNAWPGTWS